MTSPMPPPGMCCICFGVLLEPATDLKGQKWDCHSGECAVQTGVVEWAWLDKVTEDVKRGYWRDAGTYTELVIANLVAEVKRNNERPLSEGDQAILRASGGFS